MVKQKGRFFKFLEEYKTKGKEGDAETETDGSLDESDLEEEGKKMDLPVDLDDIGT